MKRYLESSQHIDWQHPDILARATQLATGRSADTHIAQTCFQWVRDHIQHSVDHQRDGTTCKASDVLQQGPTATVMPKVTCSLHCCGPTASPPGCVINASALTIRVPPTVCTDSTPCT